MTAAAGGLSPSVGRRRHGCRGRPHAGPGYRRALRRFCSGQIWRSAGTNSCGVLSSFLPDQSPSCPLIGSPMSQSQNSGARDRPRYPHRIWPRYRCGAVTGESCRGGPRTILGMARRTSSRLRCSVVSSRSEEGRCWPDEIRIPSHQRNGAGAGWYRHQTSLCQEPVRPAGSHWLSMRPIEGRRDAIRRGAGFTSPLFPPCRGRGRFILGACRNRFGIAGHYQRPTTANPGAIKPRTRFKVFWGGGRDAAKRCSSGEGLQFAITPCAE